MDATFAIAGRTISVAAVIVTIAFAQWLLFAAASLFARRHRNLLVSSSVMAIVWIAFAAAATTKTKAIAASAISPVANGTCATLEQGVTADQTRAHLGKPDEVRNEEAIRGPLAEVWIYRGTRCAVHLVEGKVTFVE